MMAFSSPVDRRTRPAGCVEPVVCAACRTAVARDEAVAARADDVVHARCHPIVIAIDRERAAAA